MIAEIVCIVGLPATVASVPFWLPAVKRRVLLRRSPSPAAELVLMLLDREDGWEITEHRAVHATGVGIWISNGEGSVSVAATNGSNVWPSASWRDCRDQLSLTATDRALIWAAYQKLVGGKAMSSADKQVIDLAARIQAFSDQLANPKVVPIRKSRSA